ncbi:MAG: ferritin-like domain-containing protein [Elusimicrobiota bacterium]
MNKAVIDVLNKARADELGAILQYMAQHYRLADNDYGEVAANIKLIAIDEMRHAEMFAERIYELGGMPTTTPDKPAKKGQDIRQALAHDSKEEQGALVSYNKYMNICLKNNDSISAKLFEQIIKEEQEHLNYFDDVLNHIKELGNSYLAKIAGGAAEAGAPPKGFMASKGGA